MDDPKISITVLHKQKKIISRTVNFKPSFATCMFSTFHMSSFNKSAIMLSPKTSLQLCLHNSIILKELASHYTKNLKS